MRRGRFCLLLLVLLTATAARAWSEGIPSQDPTDTITGSVTITDESTEAFSNLIGTLMTPGGSTTVFDVQATIPADATVTETFSEVVSFESSDDVFTMALAMIGISATGGTVPGCGILSGNTPPPNAPSACPAIFTDDDLSQVVFRNLAQGQYVLFTQSPSGSDPPVAGGSFALTVTVSPTPEPGTGVIMLIGVGLAGLMTVRRNRNSRRHPQAS